VILFLTGSIPASALLVSICAEEMRARVVLTKRSIYNLIGGVKTDMGKRQYAARQGQALAFIYYYAKTHDQPPAADRYRPLLSDLPACGTPDGGIPEESRADRDSSRTREIDTGAARAGRASRTGMNG
jgi:hypothetical protein